MDNAVVLYQEGHTFEMGIKKATGGRIQLGVAGAVSQIASASGGIAGAIIPLIELGIPLFTHYIPYACGNLDVTEVN
jgi:hypothetical protein